MNFKGYKVRPEFNWWHGSRKVESKRVFPLKKQSAYHLYLSGRGRFPMQNVVTNIGRSVQRLSAAGLLAVLLFTACSTTKSGVVTPLPSAAPLQFRLKVESDQRTLCNVAGQLENTRSEFIALHQRGGWAKRGYFDTEENNQVERFYFRFVVGHTTLWDVINGYGGPQARFSADENGIKAHALVLYAEFLLAFHTSFFVAEFMGDPVAIAKLNEPFFRSEIPQGTYDRLRRDATSKDKTHMLTAAWMLYSEDVADPQSLLVKLGEEDPVYAHLLGQIPILYSKAKQQTQRILKAQAGAEIYFSHTRAAELARAASREYGELKYAIRSLLFKDISRLKNPNAHLIRFSAAQKRKVYDLLQPGDLILTFTAGYISDVFIPGMFKHGITYVGSPAQRAEAGLKNDSLPVVAEPERKSFDLHIAQEFLPGGENADIIEAVAEGVIFNNLAKIMDTHINRLLVLRPILNDAERTQFLAGVFSYMGDEYDFYFDFADASRQVCTEVHYRTLNGRGGIDFTLTERAGHETLSADDIVHYYTETRPKQFELVLFADEDPDSQIHQARVLTGAEAEHRLKELMAAARP